MPLYIYIHYLQFQETPSYLWQFRRWDSLRWHEREIWGWGLSVNRAFPLPAWQLQQLWRLFCCCCHLLGMTCLEPWILCREERHTNGSQGEQTLVRCATWCLMLHTHKWLLHNHLQIYISAFAKLQNTVAFNDTVLYYWRIYTMAQHLCYLIHKLNHVKRQKQKRSIKGNFLEVLQSNRDKVTWTLRLVALSLYIAVSHSCTVKRTLESLANRNWRSWARMAWNLTSHIMAIARQRGSREQSGGKERLEKEGNLDVQYIIKDLTFYSGLRS